MTTENAKLLKKSHHSVKEMLEDIGVDRDVIDTVEEVRRQNVTNTLAKIRLSKGLTQKEMAKLLKCTQGRISKLETGKDADLRLKDLSDYAEAAHVSLSVTIGPRTCAEAIKHHLLSVKQFIDKLVALDDGNDATITDGIRGFLDRLLWDTAELIGRSKLALKKADAQKANRQAEIEIISSSGSLTGTSANSLAVTKGKIHELANA
jgi:transcriptional regulator with XRE-family HTH domain